MDGIKPIKGKDGNCWERTKDVTYQLKTFRGHRGTVFIRRKTDDVVLAMLKDNVLHIFKGYAHNGCSMSPDFRRARRGCEVHDVLVQMLQEGAESFTLEMANDALLEMQKRDSFRLRKIYHWAVNTWFARKFMKL
jgi:hypothetical protein